MNVLRLVLAMLLAALAAPATAHETTRSYLTLDRTGSEVTARLRLAFRDIDVVVWMDEDLDGRVTWREAQARLDEAISYATARVSLDAGGACPLRSVETGVSQTTGVDYLDMAFAATLFAEIDPGHRMFLTASEGSREASAVIGAADGAAELSPQAGSAAAFTSYFGAGVEHFLTGADHIVFLLVLILPALGGHSDARRRFLGVISAVTGFTIAHALTLTAATTAILRPPSALIEALIALSIVVTAIDNVRPFIPGPRTAVAAFFGTIHGFGFATALSALSLSGGGFIVALLGFNLGIEAAQVGVVMLAMPALAMLGGGVWIVRLGSTAAAAVALTWLWQRLPSIIGLS
jgi:hypothetical protein